MSKTSSSYPNRFDRNNRDFDKTVLAAVPEPPDTVSASDVGRTLGYRTSNLSRRVIPALLRLADQNLVTRTGWTRGGWPLWSKKS